jgi:hypothetical protein
LELKNFFVQDDQGNKLPGATCYVYGRGTENLLTNVVSVTGGTLTNPFKSDENGLVQFAAANGLYDVRVVTDTRDFRIHLQFNDVDDDLAAAQGYAHRAEAALDASLLSRGNASSIEDGLAKTVDGEFFSVASDDVNEFVILYKNTAGTAVEVKRYPSAKAIAGSVKSFKTLALMLLDLSADDEVRAMVTNDQILENNGWYEKVGASGAGSWIQLNDQPAVITVANDVSEEMIGALVGVGGKATITFDKKGDVHIGSLEQETRNYHDWFPQIWKPVRDSSFRIVDGYDPVTGESYAVPIALGPIKARLDVLEAVGLPRDIGIYDEAYPKATVTGRVVTIGGELRKEGASFLISGSVTIDATASVAGVAFTGNLPYNAILHLTDGQAADDSYRRVKHAFNTKVTRIADSVLLTLGVDYALSADGTNSTLTGLVSTAVSTPVSVVYDYKKERYDLIQLNTETLALEVIKGVERSLDAHENFYRAKPTNGCIPLYYVYVYGETVTLIDASAWLEGYPGRLHSAGFPAIRQHAQRCLSKVMGKLIRGETIRMAGYGDSITAQGNGTIPDLATANGPFRDRTEHYGTLYPYDTRVLAGLYDLGDGVGLRHVKTGSLWTLKTYLESRFGVTITYDNWGIGSTTSAATENNGLWPARFNPLLASKPDLAILGFGMNELGSATTYANMRSIAEQLITGGAEIIILGVPRRNYMSENINGWRYTNRMLRRVALDVGAAYVPYADVADDVSIGCLGIAPKTLCSTNMVNHPGYREVELYGKLICSLF